MPSIPSIQSLVGDHSGGVSIGVDWTNNRAFELSNTNLSRYGLTTGLEEAYAPLANMGGVGEDGLAYYTGIAANGNIFISASGSLSNGAAMYVNGTTLAMINLIVYPNTQFGLGGMIGVRKNSTQYMVDKGLGDNIISTLNRFQIITTSAWFDLQGFTGVGGKICSGPDGDGIFYIISRNNAHTNMVLSSVTISSMATTSYVTIGSPITLANIDAGWSSELQIEGMCLDQTDGKILAVISGSGNSNKAYLAKINPTNAAIDWKSVIPASDGGGAVSVGELFHFSDIQNQRVAFYTGSPPTVTIYNTSNGSVADTYSTGLSGFSVIDGQCYNDTRGCIVLGCDFSYSASSPTRLNSTPTSWSDGFAVLYVAAGVAPTPGNGNRRWLASIRSMKAA